MRSHTALRLACFGALILTIGTYAAKADDADTVKEKLFQAKKEYDKEVQKYKQSVLDAFEKQEESVRAKGDKKALDQLKANLEAFQKSGDLPPTFPGAPKQRVALARTTLDKAYAVAVKDLLRMKNDAEAGVVDKERDEFLLSSSFLIGKRAYLNSLKPFGIKTHLNNSAFSSQGTRGEDGTKLKMAGELVPHSQYMHPPPKGIAEASYPLAGKWSALRVTVGIPKIEDVTGNPEVPLVFEILGDGKSLWSSEPVTKIETFQTCDVKVEKVKTLTLRVNCPGNNAWARTVWFEPILVE